MHVPCFAAVDELPAAAGSMQPVLEPEILGLCLQRDEASALSVVDALGLAADVAILDTVADQEDSGLGAAPRFGPDRLTFLCFDPAWTVELVGPSSIVVEPGLMVADFRKPDAHLAHFPAHRQPSLFDCVS